MDPPHEGVVPPNLNVEACGVHDSKPRCEFTAKADGGIVASGDPNGWTATIKRAGRAEPIQIVGHGGFQFYPCRTIEVGDHVVLEAKPGSMAVAGNPGICF